MTALDNAPAHWTRTTIGEIAEVRLGRQRSPENHSGDDMRPYLRAANVDWYSLRLGDIAEMNFTDDEMKTYALRAGDILIVEGSGSASEVGKCVVVPEGYEDHGFQNTLIRVRPGEGIDSRWLMYRVNAEAELGGFLTLARGSGIFHLGSTRTGKWPIAIPPLDEQHGIVAEIERLNSRIEIAAIKLAGLGDRTERLRQARYAELLDSAPDPTPLSEIGSVELGKMMSPDRRGGTNQRPYLRGANVAWGGFDLNDLQTMSLDDDELERYSVRRGDVVVVEGAGSATEVGRCAIWRHSEPILYQKALHRIRPGASVTSDWVAACLTAMVLSRRIEPFLTGTTIRHLSRRNLRRVPIPVPSLSVQRRLTDALMTATQRDQRLATAARQATVRSADLRRSILKAAFEGRL